MRSRTFPARISSCCPDFSTAPLTTDVKLSGEAEAIISQGHLTRLEAGFRTSSGTIVIDDKDMPPIEIGAASGQGAWDETGRKLSLGSLAFKASETDIRLQGEAAAVPGQGWRLTLSGTDAVVSGPEPGDRPFTVSTMDVSARVAEGVLALERLALRGPALDVIIDAAYGAPDDPKALRVNGSARQTAVRTALRLWPNSVVPKVRNHLVANLRGGTAEVLNLAVTLSGRELAGALAEEPVPDRLGQGKFRDQGRRAERRRWSTAAARHRGRGLGDGNDGQCAGAAGGGSDA